MRKQKPLWGLLLLELLLVDVDETRRVFGVGECEVLPECILGKDRHMSVVVVREDEVGWAFFDFRDESGVHDRDLLDVLGGDSDCHTNGLRHVVSLFGERVLILGGVLPAT